MLIGTLLDLKNKKLLMLDLKPYDKEEAEIYKIRGT